MMIVSIGDRPDKSQPEEQVDGEGGPVAEDCNVLEDPDYFTGQESVIMILKTVSPICRLRPLDVLQCVSHQDGHTVGRGDQS